MARNTSDVMLSRVGHVSVSVFDNRLLLIWGGYVQQQENEDDLPIFRYHDPQEVILYDPLLNSWVVKNTTGKVPPANSGTCGIVVDDFLFIYGGYFGDPDLEGNSNNLYSLNLQTWAWTRLEPNGLKPLHCDKLMGWSYKKRLFFFGGFGTPPSSNELKLHECDFVMDRSHQWYYGRGWNNQLVMYDIENNQWERPKTFGKRPSPRAAMAGFRQNDKVYIFGGRLLNTRMNDLYVLDLVSMIWSEDLNSGKFSPQGRSWHSFTALGSSRAILYGGLSSEGLVKDDVWLYNTKENIWTEMQLTNCEKRLWHQAVYIDTDWICVGGVRTNLHSSPQERLEFAHQLLTVSVTPKSLLRLSIEMVSSFANFDESIMCYLPKYLQNVIRVRRQNNSQSLVSQTNPRPSYSLYEA